MRADYYTVGSTIAYVGSSNGPVNQFTVAEGTGLFDAQNLITIPHAKLIRRLGRLSPPQLKAVGYGEQRLVAPGASGNEPGAQANRRVVFVVETRGDASTMTASALR